MSLADEIQAAYQKRGNTLGWRLLASPAHVLEGAEVAFIGMNPGGQREEPDQPRFAPDHGSAYEDEIWGNAPPGQSKLQRQVQALFAGLGVAPSDVLAGNLVPFRSPDWSALQDKQGSLAFGQRLWKDIVARAKPSLVVTMGGPTFDALAGALMTEATEKHLLGWGTVAGRRAVFDGGALIGLPHLSRFGVMKREQSQEGLAALFGPRWRP